MTFQQNDPEGKIWFAGWLENHHYKNVKIIENPYSPYDIEADKDGKHYVYELKARPINSYAWNDSIIELQKFNILKNLGDERYIVNFFHDCFYIVDLFEDHEFQDHYCQRTNNWNRDKIKKILVSYKHKNENRYEYN